MDDFPIIAHEAADVNCRGCLVVKVKGHDAELTCTECAAVAGVIDVRILRVINSLIPVGRDSSGEFTESP